ncbi:MAG: lycopene cyclase domain-containing protein [Aggregatilineales bacterium]
MTYFGFLGLFVATPIAALALWMWLDVRRGRLLPLELRGLPSLAIIAAHMVIAFVYTTPWDNYLVATRVWWYDPDLVTGITLGYVPVEEYTFFLLQPILTGLLLFALARYLPRQQNPKPMPNNLVRYTALIPTAALWLVSVAMLVNPWPHDTYLGLILVWALIPFMGQLVFGADILWRERLLVFPTIAISTLYLAFADSLAIVSGTWTIDPDQSLPILLGGVLPVEEFLFFLMTNVLIACGATLMASQESRQRVTVLLRRPRRFVERQDAEVLE